MKQTLISFLLFFCHAALFSQFSQNMTLFDQFDRGDDRYAGSWIYNDVENAREYALLGTTSGTAIYDITDYPIKEVAFITGPYSRWREITVVAKYAYVVTEGSGVGEGMQVIDLQELPLKATLITTYTSTFTRGHIIQSDIYSDSAYVYINGTCGSCGVNILDVSDPFHPKEVGNYKPGYYIHDCHVKGNYLYAAAFYEGVVDIVDISDKTQPRLVAQIEDPGGNTHSCWLSEDNRFLFISDELDGLPARIWNVEDLNNMYEVATYSANEESLTHNPYVRGDFTFFSHNTEGIRVLDIKNPEVPVEVAYYDTYDGESGGFNGLWSACPYSASGKIIGGDRANGLYVWTFNEVFANRIYFSILDADTKSILDSATVLINGEQLDKTARTNNYVYGTIDSVMHINLNVAGYTSLDTTLLFLEGEEKVLNFELEKSILSNSNSLPKLNNMVTVYPNPFKEYTLFDISKLSAPSIIAITNTYSKELLRFSIEDRTQFSLDHSPLMKGIYYYFIYDANRQPIAIGRIIKL